MNSSKLWRSLELQQQQKKFAYPSNLLQKSISYFSEFKGWDGCRQVWGSLLCS